MKYQNMKMLAVAAVAGLGLAFGGNQASGSIVYQYVAQQGQYSGNPGQVIPVNVYLQESLTGSSQSFIASDGGLSGFGVLATEVSAGGTSALTGIADSPSFGGLHNDVPPDASGASATMDATIALGSPGVNVGNGGSGISIPNAVYLGTLSVTVGPGSTTFSLGAIDPVNGGNTTTKNNVYDLDLTADNSGLAANTFTPAGAGSFTVTASPEPGSLGVLALGGLLALRRRRA